MSGRRLLGKRRTGDERHGDQLVAEQCPGDAAQHGQKRQEGDDVEKLAGHWCPAVEGRGGCC
jgi:hypothetical protein